MTHFGQFRTGIPSGLINFDVVVTSYDALVADHAILRAINWNIVILDEAQNIKNPEAKRTLRSKGLPREFGLAISGTPLENRLRDIWSLSDFAQPGLFGSEDSFANEYESESGGALEVNRILRSIMLRRKLSDIDHQLPEKIVKDYPLRWPEELNQVEIGEVEMDDEEEDSDEATDGTTVEWDLTKKDDEDEEQMKLF